MSARPIDLLWILLGPLAFAEGFALWLASKDAHSPIYVHAILWQVWWIPFSRIVGLALRRTDGHSC